MPGTSEYDLGVEHRRQFYRRRTTAASGEAIPWTSAAMVVLIEVAVGVRAGQSGRDLFRQAALGAVLGFLLIVVKSVLH